MRALLILPHIIPKLSRPSYRAFIRQGPNRPLESADPGIEVRAATQEVPLKRRQKSVRRQGAARALFGLRVEAHGVFLDLLE